ncbi:biogenesis of lysosome-related organelles complex 1 subunit 4 [Nilaparvata lugens]|uniref:biogenesis of lysosome-related organelles complex 1 subunit 4 n=1 Tax=Nilaparvata lugens TaxID=108931 RepID=UPI000B97E9AD|nr:biogenesis of lysosome-related organelles complex 1 subunit 4 [Nilaparvata lugens]
MSDDTLDKKTLVDVANDYSSFLKIDFSKDVTMVRQNVEDMLTRLEEFQSVLEMVQSEAGTEQMKQEVLARGGELDALCARVDRLEGLVQRVEYDVTAVEVVVQRAESELLRDSRAGLHKLIPTFFKKKEPSLGSGSGAQLAPFEAPQIFKTTDFFPPTAEEPS